MPTITAMQAPEDVEVVPVIMAAAKEFVTTITA
jgi:hypothetical protein